MARYAYIVEILDGDPVDSVCANARRAVAELRDRGRIAGTVKASVTALSEGGCINAFDDHGEACASAYRVPLLT